MKAWLSSGQDEKLAQKKEAPKGTGGIAHVPLKNINNQQYIGDVYFGDNNQKMTMQFDTGSAVVYVLTDLCKENCNT